MLDLKFHVILHVSPVQLSLPSTMHIVSGFDHVYVAAQLHFHWGTVEVPGSEHTVDNIHFPAEVRGTVRVRGWIYGYISNIYYTQSLEIYQ